MAPSRPPAEHPAPTTPAEGPTLLARLWAAPLWAHAAALAVVLLALVPMIGTNVSFSADEGAAIVQAHNLAEGKGWIVDHPLPQVDPDARAYPLELSLRGDNGTAPFVKHPLYALLLAGADRVGGHMAMVLLSLAGTVLAAALAAALAGHLRPGLSRPSLWVTGLATPLLFDGYLVIAHTLGAAAAAGAVLLALRAAEDGSRRGLAIAGAAGCVAVAVLLRNEAVFWGLGLGVALGALARQRRSPRLAGAAVAMAGAAGVAHIGEELWFDRILGGNTVNLAVDPDIGVGLVAGRVQSVFLTWLWPGYGEFPSAELALVVMLGAIVTATVAARRHPDNRRVIAGLATVAVTAALVALLTGPTNLVPGLLVASPVLAAGLVALRSHCLRPLGARLAFTTFAVFALAVAATQYARGGSGEWGGRYFALGLPVLVPVALLALAEAGARLDRFTRRAGVVGLVMCSLAMAVMGLATLSDTHRFTANLTATIDDAGRATVGSGGRPVMVATRGAVPRLAWATYDRQRWLLSAPDDLGGLLTRLRAAGVGQVVLVTDAFERDIGKAGPDVSVVARHGRPDGRNWQIVTVRLGP